jgi:hypothetical protein
MRLGCCSAISPCAHQQRDPHSICDTCQKAADDGADTVRDRAIRDAIRLLTSVGYTIEPPPVKERIPRS